MAHFHGRALGNTCIGKVPEAERPSVKAHYAAHFLHCAFRSVDRVGLRTQSTCLGAMLADRGAVGGVIAKASNEFRPNRGASRNFDQDVAQSFGNPTIVISTNTWDVRCATPTYSARVNIHTQCFPPAALNFSRQHNGWHPCDIAEVEAKAWRLQDFVACGLKLFVAVDAPEHAGDITSARASFIDIDGDHSVAEFVAAHIEGEIVARWHLKLIRYNPDVARALIFSV